MISLEVAIKIMYHKQKKKKKINISKKLAIVLLQKVVLVKKIRCVKALVISNKEINIHYLTLLTCIRQARSGIYYHSYLNKTRNTTSF